MVRSCVLGRTAVSAGLRLPLAGLLAIAALTLAAIAQEPEEPPLREIFVPFDDLNVILEGGTQRVFLTRDEYDALVAKAKSKPQANVPHKIALVSAEYDAQLEDGRALISGTLTIEVLDDGLFAVPLDLAGVGIRGATLGDVAAPLIRDDQQRPTVLVQGKGLHTLKLSLTAPVQTAAAQQSLNLALPANAATRLQLTVPGNVEVKGGAAVASREFDMAGNQTRLELLPQRGGMSIVMSLNNRLLQDQRVVVSRSVLVTEVTQGYERIHATVSYRVLHGAVEKLRFAVPAGFEVTKVDALQLARWEQKAEEGRNIVEATLREPTSDQVVLEIAANRSPAAEQDWMASLSNWTFPKLEPLDVAGQVAVVGLLVEDRLQAQNIESTGLVPIDAAVLTAAIPASVLKAEPGAPTVRQVVTYYAPAADYSLKASFTRPPVGLKVATNSLLVIADRGLTVTGGFALTPQAEDLFDFRFTAPAEWKVTQVTRPDGTPLLLERYPLPDGRTRVLVRLGGGTKVGQSTTVNFELVYTPSGWLTDWTTQKLDFPQVIVEDATADTGALAAQTLDDLIVRPDKLEGLTPLVDAEKATFGLADLPTALAYRYEARPITASLVIERTKPSLMAEVFSFFKIEPDNLVAHYSLAYDVREARTRQIIFSLPASTPTELSITGVEGSGTVVKEFRSEEAGDRRRWIVQLAERQIGRVRIAVRFQQRLAESAMKDWSLPLVQAEEVEYQSAFVAVEGDEELDVQVAAAPRRVDVGELSAAGEYTVGRRLIGAFGYVGTKAEVKVTVARRGAYELPAALVQRAMLTTKVSAAGRAQSLAEYELLTKATLLEIQLPTGSALWTIYLDDEPTKPQREGESLLVSLPAQDEPAVRVLKIVYETPSQSLALSGTIQARAPVLLVRALGTDAEREIPQADLEWKLLLPTGFSVERSEGTVHPPEIQPREMAALRVAKYLYALAGGIRPFFWMEAKDTSLPSVSSTFSTVESDTPPTSGGAQMAGEGFGAGKSATGGFDANMPADAAPQSAVPERSAEARAEFAPPPVAAASPTAPTPEPAPAIPPQAAEPRADSGIALDPTAAPKPQEGEVTYQKGLALEGVSSLKIDFQADSGGQTAIFRSLGHDPLLRAVVIDNRRIVAAAWALAALVFLCGVSLTRHSLRRKATYVIVVLLAATLPLLLTDRFDEVALVFDYVFFAGCLLIAYYIAAALALATWQRLKRLVPEDCCPPVSTPVVQQITAVLLAALVVSMSAAAIAQEPTVDKLPPVAVPSEAVIVPFDPSKPLAEAMTEKILVPYEKYVELWNRANPDQKLVTTAPPTDFALAGSSYQATLGSADSLLLQGTIEIDVFTDKPVAVPLRIGGGVLVRALVDGKAARLQVVESVPEPQAAAQQAANAAAAPLADGRLALLHLTGKGRKKLEVSIQLGLTRQGGWRVVRGAVPVGPAAALTLIVPQAGTEVRQQHLADKATFETTADNQQIETALGADGVIDLQWRPKVAEGQVDQSLTARSLAVFDVREDALRLTWQVNLEFGRGLRDAFTLAVPADYLVEHVTGDNLRAWQAKAVGGEQQIDVTLLKPAMGSVSLTVQLAKRGRVGQGELAEFAVPTVLVVDAALQQGEIAVRRSPRLELRTVASTGLSRADADGQTAPVEQIADAADAAVLVVKPFQTFRFVRPPFNLRLAASPEPLATSAELRIALRVAERDTTVDAAILFRPQGQPLYRVEILLPDNFELDRLGPGDLEWTITPAEGRKRLTVHLLEGRTGEFTLTLFGRLKLPAGEQPAADARPQPRQLAVPVISVLGIEKQEGDLVVLPDPDTDVRIENLKNAESVLLSQATGWLAAEQQSLAKGAIRLRSGDYGATLTLTPREPEVSVRTITNVKVTPRAIEETLFLDFDIKQAGIRRLSFLLPERFAKARVKAHLLKQKTIEPATDAAGKPKPGWVRFKLELQDYVRDRYSIVVEQDGLLTADKVSPAIPIVETGRTDRRLIAIENAGRDQIDPDKNTNGVEQLTREQQAWRDMAAILGDNITYGYIVIEGQVPSLSFTTTQRERAATADARIGLATTLLVVDAAGGYRGLQEYRLTNATEQFLEIELPEGARLWTATVAGEPVKPVEASPPQPNVVRVPLVKTAEGEGDYPVQLKYGGRMPSVTSVTQVRFPLMKTRNIHVELSQVRLLLPDDYEWLDFRGTMKKVDDQRVLEEGFQGYLQKRIEEAQQLLSSANPYTKVRVQNNLKQARILFENNRAFNARDGIQVESEGRNEALLMNAEQQAAQSTTELQLDQEDNRDRLNRYWGAQDVKRSKNVVSGLQSNFQQDALGKEGQDFEKSGINAQFFEQNQLKTKGDAAEADPNAPEASKKPGADMPAKQEGGRFYRGGKPMAAADDAEKQSGAKQAPQLFNDAQKEVQEQLKREVDELRDKQTEESASERSNLFRYQQQLDQNIQQQERLGGLSVQGQQLYGAGGGQPAGPMSGMPPDGTIAQAEAPASAPSGDLSGGGQMSQEARPVIDDSVSMPGGLASLDIQLPERGRQFSFMTPRGEIEITARPVSHSFFSRLIGLAGVLVAVFVFWIASRPVTRAAWSRATTHVMFGLIIAIIGLASIITGVLPVAGLVLLIGGIFVALRNHLARRTAAAA